MRCGESHRSDQDARIEIGSGAESIAAFGPCEVSDGALRVADGQFALIPAPFDSPGPVAVRLDLVDGRWTPSNKALQSAGRIGRFAPSRARR